MIAYIVASQGGGFGTWRVTDMPDSSDMARQLVRAASSYAATMAYKVEMPARELDAAISIFEHEMEVAAWEYILRASTSMELLEQTL